MSGKIKWGVVGSAGIARRRTIPEGVTKARNAELAVVFDIDQQVNAEIEEFSQAIIDDREFFISGELGLLRISPAGQCH